MFVASSEKNRSDPSGVHTLHLRVPAQCANAQKVAEFLAQHPKVERVNYPGLPHHPGHELARRQMKAFGAMMSFEAKGGYEGGKRVMDRVKIFLRAASLGDTRSLIVHSASTSHRAVPPEQRQAIGITDGLVRLSVGVEAVEDLIQDLDQALRVNSGDRRHAVGSKKGPAMLHLHRDGDLFLLPDPNQYSQAPAAHSDALQRRRCGRRLGKSRHPLGPVGCAGSDLRGLPRGAVHRSAIPRRVHFGSRRLSDFSPAQRVRMIPMLNNMAGCLGIVMNLFFVFMLQKVIQAAAQPIPHLYMFWPMALLLGGTLGIVLYYLWQMRRTTQSEDGGGPAKEQ